MDTKYHQYYKDVLIATTKLSTCSRVQVGAIIVSKGRILCSGYNGSMPGQPHCNEVFDVAEQFLMKSGSEIAVETHRRFSLRNEGHAEISAIATAAKLGSATDGCEMAVSHTPCLSCAKAIITSGIKTVFYLEKYDREPEGLELLAECGIECIQL